MSQASSPHGPPALTRADADHLRLLSVFYYVAAGLSALFSLFPVFHLVFGIAMVAGRLEPDDPMSATVGWIFIGVALVFIMGGLVFAACLAAAGRALARRGHYIFCVVVAAIACAAYPVGTALGVFTIIVLMRDSVKGAFGRQTDVSAAS